MKKIKLFESYLNETYENELVDSLFEKIEGKYFKIYEDEDEDVNDTNLTKGEKAAMARDNQIISRPQLAALYLKALGRIEGEEGAYLIMIDGIKDFGKFNQNTRAFYITNSALADAIGLESTGTVYRTVNKFVNLIEEIGQTSSEIIYPKIALAYEKFSIMNPVQISNLAADCIQNSSEYTLNRDKAEATNQASSGIRAEKIKSEDLVGGKVYSLTNSLKSASHIFRQPGRAQKTAIEKISIETGETEEKIKNYYKKYLISRKILNALNFYEGK